MLEQSELELLLAGSTILCGWSHDMCDPALQGDNSDFARENLLLVIE
jgi:hypothetical protein